MGWILQKNGLPGGSETGGIQGKLQEKERIGRIMRSLVGWLTNCSARELTHSLAATNLSHVEPEG